MSRAFAFILAASLLGGCTCNSDTGGMGGDDAGVPDAAITWQDCTDGDEAFVRNAYLAVLGQRPLGQAEVNAYVDLMIGARAVADAERAADPNATPPDPREVIVRALAQHPAYASRWADRVMDALKVTRIEGQSQDDCYGVSERDPDDGSLAAFVRDNPATAGDDGNGRFTMLDLLRSAIALDDVSPVYRAHLFALVARPIPAANVPPVEAELARREDFGLVFDAAYLNRDIVCLGCHNSQDSITYNPDPELNRHFAVPGLFEKAIYGDSFGIDPAKAHAAFRYDDFVQELGEEGDVNPWGWETDCGSFFPTGLSADPADIDGRFASLAGNRLTVFDLEAALDRGFDRIANSGLPLDLMNEISDPDAAFAYLVSMSIVEQVWIEVIGTPLTIANYFPRNAESRDLLASLTETFVVSRYSLVELLVAITQTPYFNRAAPEAGCGELGPYEMPTVYDPWVISDEDEARHKNGPGDAVSALSGRTLLRAADRALEWPPGRFQLFPQLPGEVFACDQFFNGNCSNIGNYCTNQGGCCYAYDYLCVNPPGDDEPTSGEERAFQQGVGVFLKNGERGFQGLDFQARLVWENRYGACRKPVAGQDDAIDRVVALAAARSGTVGDVVLAIKDRLVGEAMIEPTSEQPALEALFGASMSDPASGVTDLEDRARALCGVLVSTPQFLLGGLASRGAAEVPLLTPDSASFDTTCAVIAGVTLPGALTVTCAPGTLTVEGSTPEPPAP